MLSDDCQCFEFEQNYDILISWSLIFNILDVTAKLFYSFYILFYSGTAVLLSSGSLILRRSPTMRFATWPHDHAWSKKTHKRRKASDDIFVSHIFRQDKSLGIKEIPSP